MPVPRDVTVVVPTRNRAAVLPCTLRSVLAQRDVDLEVVVVDEASSDGTAALLASWPDRRVSVVRHDTPKGVSGARNAGIRVATGTWVAFVDDDDLWSPHKLAAQLDALAASPASQWSCSGAVSVDPQLRLLGALPPPPIGPVYPRILRGNVVHAGASSVMVRRDLLVELGGFTEDLGGVEDWDMWVRLAEASPIVAGVARPLLAYRIWPSSMSHDTARLERVFAEFCRRHAAARSAHGVRIDQKAVARFLAQQDLHAGRHRTAARRLVAAGLRSCSPRLLARAALTRWAPGRAASIERRSLVGGLSPSWRDEAEAWLAEFRAGTVPVADRSAA